MRGVEAHFGDVAENWKASTKSASPLLLKATFRSDSLTFLRSTLKAGTKDPSTRVDQSFRFSVTAACLTGVMIVTDYSKAIADLSPEKQELLELLLLDEPNQDNSFPLSFGQQRLWFIDQLEPGSFLYNVSTSVRMEGRLNVPALQRSFDELVQRHETLRTTFRLVDRQPVQVISDTADVTLNVIDLEGSAEKDQETRRLLLAEAQAPFDLSTGPLLRVKLLRLSAEEHVLSLCMHHIISDGWSLGVLVREIASLYKSISEDEPATLPELPIQYADFVLWQREWLQGEVVAEHLDYWKKQLAGAPAVLELPTDRPRPAVNSFRGAKQSVALPAELSTAIKELSEREGVTLFMTLLAAFQTLLHRYQSGRDRGRDADRQP